MSRNRAAAATVTDEALNMCAEAARLLRRCGFELVYQSMKSEACYYAMPVPGHAGVIRVAAHRGGRSDFLTCRHAVVARLTFGTHNASLCGDSHRFEDYVAWAIGRYFMAQMQKAPDSI